MLPKYFIKDESSYPGSYRLQNNFLQAINEGVFTPEKATLKPKASVTETDNYYKIELTQPGMKRENLFVSINDDGNLNIIGCNCNDNTRIELSNITDTFFAEISLPENVDSSFTSAACHAGTLSIVFTKSDKPVNRRAAEIVVY
ncbi:MAG: Hsp20/alpha crystallin family protein [Chitinophagaceae bacterium]|nr:Hsp20/alpha crystallin family protein [Chitinophagaceae bacterium]